MIEERYSLQEGRGCSILGLLSNETSFEICACVSVPRTLICFKIHICSVIVITSVGVSWAGENFCLLNPFFF